MMSPFYSCNTKKILPSIFFVSVLLVSFAERNENLCIFRKGVVVFETNADTIDSIAVQGGIITLYDKARTILYNTPQESADSILFLPPVPKADILDIMFQDNDSATDISPMANPVHKTGLPNNLFSNTYNRYISQFNNPWASTGSSYYRIDYEDNARIKNALANGHTLEALVCANYSGTIADKEAKYFTSHQSGGTGLMVCTKAKGKSKKTEFTFLPSVSTNGTNSWKYTPSGIEPVSGQFYHVVGVWNQEEGTSKVYIDGQLKNTVAAAGDLHFPTSGCNWFGIGADPASSTTTNMAWNGEVVFVRIYDAPLNANEVKSLYDRVEILKTQNTKSLVHDVYFYSGMNVTANSTYILYGQGFEKGDNILFTEIDNPGNHFTVSPNIDNLPEVKFLLPEDLTSGLYRMVVQRDNLRQDIGTNQLNVVKILPQGAQVIAHRGFWTKGNVSQNSRASLRQAFEDNYFGSETDVWITQDDSLVVNHDATLNNVRLDASTYEQVKDLKLGNGESIPRLREFLLMLKSATTQTKLIIEIKTHSSAARNMAAATQTVNLVKSLGLENHVEYIAFNYGICKKIIELDPHAVVGYLCSSASSVKTPQELHQDGISGLAYTLDIMNSYPDFLSQAQALGITTKVWTVDATDKIINTHNSGYDEIITNYPADAQRIYNYYLQNR